MLHAVAILSGLLGRNRNKWKKQSHFPYLPPFYCDRIFYLYFILIHGMTEFVLFNSTEHLDDFYQMNLESMTWHQDELLEKYQIDIGELLGLTAQDFVDNSIEKYLDLKPPEGIVLLLLVDNQVAGMLALTKIDNETGELHRMWIRTKYRGMGLSKPLLKKVLKAGTELGLIKVKLSTPKFAVAAQHLYRSAGFVEIPEYPETEVVSTLRHLWVYMETTLLR